MSFRKIQDIAPNYSESDIVFLDVRTVDDDFLLLSFCRNLSYYPHNKDGSLNTAQSAPRGAFIYNPQTEVRAVYISILDLNYLLSRGKVYDANVVSFVVFYEKFHSPPPVHF